MKTVANLEELRRHALDRGAEVVLPSGKRFNASQQRIPEGPRAKPVASVATPPPPAPASPPTLSAAEVKDMLAARDAMWLRQLETVISSFKAALTTHNAAVPGALVPTEWFFQVTYLPDGEIETVHAKAGPIAG